ncbi:MAG: dynamin family protein [Clostridia bacterium]|nr:dynamin family protein [Clostridia bacterium]
MTDFIIDYNPYLVTCTFYKNGRKIGDKTKIGSKANQRLQILLSPSTNWEGLLSEIAKVCNDTQIRITFKGRKIDFEDLLYSVDKYSGEVKFECVLEEGKNETAIMSELDAIITDIKKKKLPQFEELDSSGRGVFGAYEEAKNGIFEVSVIATMSSGKSTLINSLLHTELLPSENKACTATIARIFDNDQMDGYEAECYDASKEVVYPRSPINSEMIRAYNADESVQYIDIEGSIPSIPSNKIRLCLIDTPGPNNSRNENHERLTRSIIKRTNSVILYVMNATQIGINDDHQLLYDISNEMKRAGKQSRDRFIFVINKCDALDEEKGETIDKLLRDIREYLKGFGIEDPTLIPTSARLALLIRKNRKGDKLSRKERIELDSVEDFIDSELLHFEKYATLTPSVRVQLERQISEYHTDEDTYDLEALVHTGLPVVEATISEYIDKYAYPIKINDAIKNILNLITELNMKGRFEQSIASDSELLERVREQIKRARVKRTQGDSISQDFKKKIKMLKLDTIDQGEEQFKVEMELQAFSKEFDGKERVDKIIADQLIAEFQRKLNGYQKICESRLQRDIDEQFFLRCNELLEEYSRVVSSILEDIEIEGFDFEKVSSLGEIKITSIDEIVRSNQQDRYREETRWKDNPERAGFLGFFKFWKPRRISYTESVKDGVDINVRNVIVDILAEFSYAMKANIAQIFAQAEQQINAYKQAFNDNIDRLDAKIDEILHQLEQDILRSEEIKQKVKSDEETLKWISDIERRISTLLSV